MKIFKRLRKLCNVQDAAQLYRRIRECVRIAEKMYSNAINAGKIQFQKYKIFSAMHLF